MMTTKIGVYTIPHFDDYDEFEPYFNKIVADEVAAGPMATLTEYEEDE